LPAPPPTCIYCLSQSNTFDREHVIPQSFGTFEPESFILYDTVCKLCNNYFGRTLELSLSRDSTEALLRLTHGLKAPAGARQFPYERIALRVGEPGPWLGATVVLEADQTGSGIEPIPLPQVAFKWKGASEWTFLQEPELDESDKVAAYAGSSPGALEIRIMGSSESDSRRLIDKLGQIGIKFSQQGFFESPIPTDGKVKLEILATVDATIFRAIAKIAFNYVAYVHGKEFVLKSDFDAARNYIRFAKLPQWETIVQASPKPILFDDKVNLRQTSGHLITFDWNLGGTGFLAQVSLFNSVTYRVALCPTYSGIWHDGMRVGHHFDIDEKTISPLASTRIAMISLPT
jgi:hypothetical protein